jgi:hypothetical protein
MESVEAAARARRGRSVRAREMVFIVLACEIPSENGEFARDGKVDTYDAVLTVDLAVVRVLCGRVCMAASGHFGGVVRAWLFAHGHADSCRPCDGGPPKALCVNVLSLNITVRTPRSAQSVSAHRCGQTASMASLG